MFEKGRNCPSFVEENKLVLIVVHMKREQLAAVTAVANHQRLPINTTPADDPDVNVVDLDDGIEREDKSTSGTTSISCQESFNSDQRYSPSTQTDSVYSKSPNAVVELDPPKCVVCVVSVHQPID